MATNIRTTKKRPAIEDEEMVDQMATYQPEPDPTPETEEPQVQATPQTQAPAKRAYADEVVIDHDLYRLSLASMKKNVAFNSGSYEIVSVQHEHFFHTIDSSGTKQKYSNLVGSHFHQMIVTPNPAGGPPNVKCGPAVKEVRKLVNGRSVKVLEPCLKYPDDNGRVITDDHTHEVVYMRSNRIPIRKVNAEAIKVISADAAKGASIPGVIG